MPQIIPIKELKNTLRVSELCHKQLEPVFITKNGYGDMVLMSMETYEDMIKRVELYRELAISEKQFEEGETKEAFSALGELRERYGLQTSDIEAGR